MPAFHDEFGVAYELEDGSPEPLAVECVWCQPRHVLSIGTLPASSGMCPAAKARLDAEISSRERLADGLQQSVAILDQRGGGAALVGDAYRRVIAGGLDLLFGREGERLLDVPPFGHR